MSKKTKAELAQEGKQLATQLQALRKGPQNFALFLGPDGPALVLHKTRDATALRAEAKKQAGGPQGVIGTVGLEGQVLVLSCAEGEQPPAKLGRSLKVHLKQRGVMFKVKLVDAAGEILETDDGEEPPPEAEAVPSSEKAEDDLRPKLEAAYQKLIPLIETARKQLPPARFKSLQQNIENYQGEMARENYRIAVGFLKHLRGELSQKIRPQEVTTPDVTQNSGPSAKQVLEKAATVNTVVTRIARDPAFFAQARPQLTALRNMVKAALAGTLTEDERKGMAKMKARLDTLFLDELKRQGHGPQRHEGEVTTQQLTDRAVQGHDPMTGTTRDGVHRGLHKYGRHATRFKNPGDYVDADETLRANPAFETEKQTAKNQNMTRFTVTLPIGNVLGPDFAAKLEGVTREGSARHPTGFHATDFTGGNVKAIYHMQTDGGYHLVTLYPDLPSPQPATA